MITPNEQAFDLRVRVGGNYPAAHDKLVDQLAASRDHRTAFADEPTAFAGKAAASRDHSIALVASRLADDPALLTNWKKVKRVRRVPVHGQDETTPAPVVLRRSRWLAESIISQPLESSHYMIDE